MIYYINDNEKHRKNKILLLWKIYLFRKGTFDIDLSFISDFVFENSLKISLCVFQSSLNFC